MDARILKFRSRGRLLSRLPAFLVVTLWQTCLLEAQSANPIPPERMLDSVVEKEMSFNSHIDGKSGVAITSQQKHYVVRFNEGENFEFYIAGEFALPSLNTFMNKGFTIYHYNEGRDFLPISNRLLMYRQALLASEQYFAQEARRAGFTLNFMYADPIRVVVGKTTTDGVAAQANFSHNWICFDARRSMRQTIPVHEYFHFVQNAIWYRDVPQYNRVYEKAEEPFLSFLNDMTADWAADEPIAVPASPGYPATDVDTLQKYLTDNGSRFIREGDRGFFADFRSNTYHHIWFPARRYQASLLVKYWAEQMAGQQDKSAAASLLKALRRIQDLGGINQAGFFLGLTEPLPPRFDGPGEEYRWRQFFRHFCASNVIQKASYRSDTNDPIGYHDEAFQSVTYRNQVEQRLHSDSRVSFDKVWAEPASSDAERLARLKTLRGGTDEIRALAHKLYLFDLANEKSQPRNIFLYAQGEPGTDLYLLRHRQRWNSPDRRAAGSMDLLSEFTFSDQTDAESPEDFIVVENIDHRHLGDYLWLGLVNAATKLHNRKITWAYLAAPALMEESYGPNRGDTDTVRLVKGNSLQRWQFENFQTFADGDEFEIRIQSSGTLHHRRADLDDLRKEDVSLEFKILDRFDNELPLEAIGGRTLKVRATPHPSEPHAWNYFISGKLGSDIEYTGRCRFHIRISSPLNLGERDEQIDESYEFQLTPLKPYLDRLEIRQGEELIYDNHQGLRLPPQEQNGAFTMNIKATFTRGMDDTQTVITAGPAAPCNQYRVRPLVWRGNEVCEGRLVIPKAEVPASGMILRFSASGVSVSDLEAPATPLDSDLLKPGPQPDTSHFLIVGPDEYWEVSQSSSCRQYIEAYDRNLLTTGSWGPLRGSTRLVISSPVNGKPNVHTMHPEKRLEMLQEGIVLAQKSVKELEADLKKVSAPDFNAAPEEIQFYRDALLRQRLRLELMTTRIKPALESLIRVWSGYRELEWKPELCGPVEMTFSGMNVDWGPMHDAVDYADGRLLADGEFIDDAVAEKIVYGHSLSAGKVWNFWPSDLKRIQQAINLLGWHCPDYVTVREPEGPYRMQSDALRLRVWGHLSTQREAIVDTHGWLLSKALWSFVPPSECPFDDSVFEGNDELMEKREWTRLPDPESGRLIHLSQVINLDRLPLQYEKIENYRLKGESDSGERILRDEPDMWIKESWRPLAEHLYQNRMHSRIKTTEPWIGPDRPDRIKSFFNHPAGDRIHLYDEQFYDATRWSVSSSNCLSRFRVHPSSGLASVYMYPENDLGNSTIRGTIETRTDREYARYEWDTNWTLKRIGDPLPEDPREPFPEWNEKLGDPPSLDRPDNRNASGDRARSDSSSADSGQKQPKPKNDVKNPPKKPDKPPVKKKETTEASSFDPETGITTKSKKNPDGSRTVSTIDEKGVRSKKTVSEADRRRIYGSMLDPQTGKTTTVVGNDDGSRTITVTDREGNVKSRRRVSVEERKRPWASIRDPRTGQTMTSERLPDGRVKITTRDADGRLVGRPVYRAPK